MISESILQRHFAVHVVDPVDGAVLVIALAHVGVVPHVPLVLGLLQFSMNIVRKSVSQGVSLGGWVLNLHGHWGSWTSRRGFLSDPLHGH